MIILAEQIKKSWIQNIWNQFNSVISKFSNGLSQLNTTFTTAKASDINTTLNNKISQMKSDYYLQHESNLFTAYTITQGSKIENATKTNFDNEVAGFSVLVCKNTMNYNNGTTPCNNGGDNNTYNDRGSYNRGVNNSYCSSIVQESRSSNSNGSYSSSRGCNNICSNAKACTSNGSTINLRCTKTSDK